MRLAHIYHAFLRLDLEKSNLYMLVGPRTPEQQSYFKLHAHVPKAYAEVVCTKVILQIFKI